MIALIGESNTRRLPKMLWADDHPFFYLLAKKSASRSLNAGGERVSAPLIRESDLA